jgi:hypothetical protein
MERSLGYLLKKRGKSLIYLLNRRKEAICERKGKKAY